LLINSRLRSKSLFLDNPSRNTEFLVGIGPVHPCMPRKPRLRATRCGIKSGPTEPGGEVYDGLHHVGGPNLRFRTFSRPHRVFGGISHVNPRIPKKPRLRAARYMIDRCCFYYFVRNSLVASLEVLCAQNQ